jgi:RNA polymerase II subunit A-like phosphatase
MSKLYEMHVYTAGSRSYANAVCKGIDPKGKYFSERILSRDESGSEFSSAGGAGWC